MDFQFQKDSLSTLIKKKIILFLEKKIKDQEGIFIICRSGLEDISFEQFLEELEKILHHHTSVMRGVYLNQKYCDGLAKRSALKKYESKISHIIEEEGIFERLGLWEKINEISQRKIFISHGSYLILEQTSSFFVIDVNSGKNLKVGTKELNLLASGEICRLIKILGLGGKIIIDFLPCSKFEKKEIHTFIVGFFQDESRTSKIWGWTNGGSFELEREREKSPLNLLVTHN